MSATSNTEAENEDSYCDGRFAFLASLCLLTGDKITTTARSNDALPGLMPEEVRIPMFFRHTGRQVCL